MAVGWQAGMPPGHDMLPDPWHVSRYWYASWPSLLELAGMGGAIATGRLHHWASWVLPWMARVNEKLLALFANRMNTCCPYAMLCERLLRRRNAAKTSPCGARRQRCLLFRAQPCRRRSSYLSCGLKPLYRLLTSSVEPIHSQPQRPSFTRMAVERVSARWASRVNDSLMGETIASRIIGPSSWAFTSEYPSC